MATHSHSGFIIPTATNEATGQQQLSHITINSDFSANAYVIGWVNRGSAFITSADGKYLFTTSIMEGKMPKATSEEEVFGETPDASSTDIFDNVDAEKKLYQLYATRYYETTKSFSSFFPFAQLSNPIDSLDHLKFAGNDKSSESLAFIFNSIVDPTAKQLHANLYFASVPFVCSLQLEGVTCQEDFVGVGDTCHLVFNVINTGNLGISSFKAKLCYDKEGKNVFTELTLEQLADKVVLSEEHLDVETGEQALTAADKTGVFLPGEKRLFKTTFTVPEAWKDKKEIELFVFVYAPAVAKISDGFTDFGEDISDTTYIDMQTTDALASAVSLDIDTNRQGTIEGLSEGLYRSWNTDSGDIPPTNDGSLPLMLAATAAVAASGLAFGMKAIHNKTRSNTDSITENDSENNRRSPLT